MNIGGIKITSGISGTDDETDWTTTQIRGSEKGTVIGSWIVAVITIVFGAIFIGHSYEGFFISKNFPNPFYCIFGSFSLFLIAKATWETIRLKRFGDPMLELNTAPIPLGGTVEGRVNIRSGADKAPEFTVKLACIRRVQTSTGKSSHTSEKVLWSADTKASLLLGGILPISMTVPADQPHTNGTNPFDRILWRLTVKAPFPGQAFLEKYEVPVGNAPCHP